MCLAGDEANKHSNNAIAFTMSKNLQYFYLAHYVFI